MGSLWLMLCDFLDQFLMAPLWKPILLFWSYFHQVKSFPTTRIVNLPDLLVTNFL